MSNTGNKSMLAVALIFLITISSYAAAPDPFLDAPWGWEEIDPLADIKKRIIPPCYDYEYYYQGVGYNEGTHRRIKANWSGGPETFFNNFAKYLKETATNPDKDGQYNIPDAAIRGFYAARLMEAQPHTNSPNALWLFFTSDPELASSDAPLFCYMLDATVKPFCDDHYGTATEKLNRAWPTFACIFLMACKFSRLNLINFFLKKELVVNIDSCMVDDGLTALHYACKNGHFELVAKLLAHGACSNRLTSQEVSHRGADGHIVRGLFTPLDFAKANRADRIIGLIEQHQIDFPKQHNASHTAKKFFYWAQRLGIHG